MSALAVPEDGTPATRGPDIPFFEGKPVTTTKLKVTSTAGLDIENRVLKTDDIIRIVVEARVAGVNHVVNERSGEMERVHTAKALTVEITPWNSSDPEDTGVFRV